MARPFSAILAIPITNHATKNLPQAVLAEVTFSSTGSMKMVMTEGAQIFRTDLNKKAISSLIKDPPPDWPETFQSLLVQVGADQSRELVAVAHTDRMTVIFRECADVPLKLCSFEVPASETEEVSLYDWTIKAVRALERERKDYHDNEKKAKDDAASLRQAKEQLQRLRHASQNHETELLTRFCRLLNSKKDKIRELQSQSEGHGKQYSGSSKKARYASREPAVDNHDHATVSLGDPGLSSSVQHDQDDDNDYNLAAQDEAQSSDGSSPEDDNASDTGEEDEEL